MATSLNRWRVILAIACLIILLLIAAVITLLFLRFNSKRTCSSCTDVCTSEECISASVLLLKNMDFQADPCQDFFQFSCGGYIKQTVFRPDTIHYGDSKFREISIELQHMIFELLALPADKTNDVNLTIDSRKLNQAVEQLPQNFFNSCVNYKKLKTNPISALQQVVWKDVQESVNITFKKDVGISKTMFAKQLTTSLMVTHALIGDFFFMMIELEWETFVKGIMKENNFVIQSGNSMFLFDGQQNISQTSNFFNNILNPKYKIYNEFSQISHLSNMTQRLVMLHEEFSTIKNQFCHDGKKNESRKLTFHQLINYEQYWKKENDTTLRSLGEALDWVQYFEKVFPKANFSMEKEIIFINPLCLSKLLITLQDSLSSSIDQNEQPPVSSVLLNINLLAYLSNILTTEHQNLFIKSNLFNLSNSIDVFNAEGMLFGKTKANEEWRDCISAAIVNLEPLTIWLYVQRYFRFGETAILKLSDEIKQAFKTNVQRAQWLSAHSKQLIAAKVDNIHQSTAFPNFTLDDVHQLYLPVLKELKTKEEGLREQFGTLFALTLKSKTRLSLDLVFNNEISVFRFLTPLQANAFNYQMGNAIVFPVGILRPPVFHPKYPDYVNYALAGYMIGHEIGHSFDETGHEYSLAYIENHIWDNVTEVEFLKRQNCFKEAYGKYELGFGVRMDGNSTAGNNVADAMGFRSAFTAWQLAGYPGARLPGRLSEYTTNQLFFIFFAQIWCERLTTNQYVERFKDKPSHGPGKFRILGIVSNNEDFSNTFNCPRFSPMNPEKKCKVW